MADIRIISRVVPRGGSGISTSFGGGGAASSVDISGKLDKSVWDSVFKLYYDDPDNPDRLTSIGAQASFFSIGDVSAYGKSDEESGGTAGATSLYMLEDVDLHTPVSNGQALIYDSVKGKWTNKAAAGLDVSAMWAELTKSDESKKIDISHIPDLGGKYVSQIKIGDTAYSAENGVISLPTFPTKLSQLEDDILAGKYLPLTGGTVTGLLIVSSLKIGNALLKYDATNNAVYVEKEDGTMANFYATGEVSAFGSTSGGSSGATSLHMLDDVDLTVPLSDGMVLTYDSIKSKWTNKKGGGLDVSAMWAELSKSDTSKTIHFSHIPDLGSVYAKQVKLGTVAYSVASGVISLPAYPTIPTALKNPYGLTISLNGTSQGSYDGSASKSINITASSIGAAISSDLSKYVLKAGDTVTGNLTINGTTTTNNIVLNKAGNYGNKINFGDGDYVYLKEDTDDHLTIFGSKGININANDGNSIDLQIGNTKYHFDGGNFYPFSGTVNLGGGWNYRMFNNLWVSKIGANIIGNNPDDAHDGGSPWYGIRFTGGASGMDISGYYGIGFYTSNGRMIYLGNNQSHIVNLYAEGNANTDSSFVSSMTDRWRLQWPIYFNPDNAVFGANQLSLMMYDSCRPIISWKDTLDGIGWQTRYTIGTYRPDYNTWGTMLIAVSNDDGGNSPGIRLELEASNNRVVVQGSFLASGEITAYSDARLKSSIKPLRNRGSITPVSYIKDGKESIGFIAQDMIELYPELVSIGSSKEHYLSVNYAQYTAVLQAQIIELHKEIDDLKRKFIN
ncbi:tail fiber domain-containing protein [Phocaeicola faecalis]